ncbi:hypothetical protein RND81_04G217700 [Saponaria officinalis]|uniref:Pseudouridine synthase RsuA/RluA-like domain-containing protein n=1 Tax=Saponaria officinalis TaxID=3572 RepID=A0AAW1LQ87_SAPOF
MKNLFNLLKTPTNSFTNPLPQKPSTFIFFSQSISPISISSSKTQLNQQNSNSISMNKQEEIQLKNDPSKLNYPIPLSPQLPAISKEIELNRAMSASSRSSLFVISRVHVIFEDQWLLVVNKPSGIYCENVLSSASSVLFHDSDDSTGPREFHLANRLDRDTSGVMIITKMHKAASKLVKAFTEHKVQKTYIALCVGSAPKWSKIRLKSGHGRSKYGAWRVYATSDVGRTLPGGSSVRDMETVFEVISINGKIPSNVEEKDVIVEERSSIEAKHEDEIVVRALPKSGRTHQIRLHCQYLGMPIKGDVKYEGVYEWNDEICDGHSLHAESLSFEHPMTGVLMQVHAPLPLWASQAMQL